ncbi:MAG: aminodeoxychorismate/anthranilate synthase component II [Gammaproteobacteria bacterium]|nr:aminodeoxychorismate/anthranilate synthase component II [Gammaproteobacteria bacterium]
MILMIDNYDSFTYNLVQYFLELGNELKVVRNDEISVSEISNIAPKHIVISPGPCSPDQAGISLKVIEHYAGKIPILGVCLGHQAIAQHFGAKIVKADNVMHGKTSKIHHQQKGIFASLPSPFLATRYHSLVIKPSSLPDCFSVTAWTQNQRGENEYIMGIRHKHLSLEGVQFHPESILSEHGHQLLQNFINANS